jgi:O-succinylbenzoic acid--CoA ligase
VGPRDLVAVERGLGPTWPDIVRAVLDTGAALLPVDPRLTEGERDALLRRARPTHRLGRGGPIRMPDGRPVDADVLLVVPTSGTTGEAKLVELARPAVEAAVRLSARALGARPGDRWVACLPPAHIGGLLVLLRAELTGGRAVVVIRSDPASLAEVEASFASLVPTTLARLLDAGADLSRLRAILVGGAGLDARIARRARETGARVVRTYGLTESCGGVVYDGRPLPEVAVRLGERDEVELSGPTLMRGYREAAAATAARFTPDGWLRTGDAGTMSNDGVLSVLGRLDGVIVTGGEKVSPREVEAVLRGHPGVRDVRVASRPDPEWGERVVAFVVPVEGRAPPGLEELRDFAGNRLAPFKLPREVVVAAGRSGGRASSA